MTTTRPFASRAGFVGRERELASLADRLRAAAGGAGQVVLLAGEPGAGKSRLAEEIRDQASALGLRTCWARSPEEDGSPPYWPFRQLIRALSRSDPWWRAQPLAQPAAPSPARTSLGVARADLALIVPELDHLEAPSPGGPTQPHATAAAAPTAGSADAGGTGTGDAGTGDEQRLRAFEAVAEFLAAAADPSGMLVVFDDLQWADPASLRLLTYLAQDVALSRLMVLATYRDTEVGGGTPLRRTLAALAREPSVTRLRLVGLTESEVGRLLSGVAGWEAPASVAAAVSRRTQGNPFFVTEIGRVLAAEPPGEARAAVGAGAGGGARDGSWDGPLPDGVRDAIRGRLARLPASCQRVVAAAAVLGTEVEPASLAVATGWALERVLAALDEAEAAGIVTGTTLGPEQRARLGDGAVGPGTWRFGHDLIREAARLEMPTADRLALHGRMAEYLAGRVDAAERVSEVAVHWLESLPAGDPAQAVSWARRAAERAERQLAWEETASFYGRALAVAADAALGERDRCHLLLASARAQMRSADMAGARRSLLAAAEIARRAGDARTIAEAVLTLEGVGDFIWWEATGRALYQEALTAIPEQDSPLRARLLAQFAVNDAGGSFAATERMSVAALAMAERVGDRRAVLDALRARQIALSGPGGTEQRLALGDRMLAIGVADRDDEAVLWGRLWRFDAFAQLGEIDRAEAEVDLVAAAAERTGSSLARWHLLRCQAAIALARGRFDDAQALGEQSFGLARRAGHDSAVLPTLGFLLVVRAQTGQADRQLDELLGWSPAAMPGLRPIRALLLLMQGEREQARQIYRTMAPPTSLPGFMLLPALAGTAELAAEFDDRETAGEMYRLLSPFADRFVCGGAGIVAVLGSARLPLGLAAACLGRLDDAVRHLRAAVEIHERAGVPPQVATARYQLARVLGRRRRPGDRDEGAALARSAEALAARLGMRPLRRWCQELVESLAQGGSGRGKGLAAGSPLTPREREIAVLVSQGLTSRQIAAATHISERTAENHVQHILGKLGFTSRSQIAAWVAGQGHPRPPVA
ncbi:AAA family ATPase [Pseudofrankia sp. BMG5.37]|uniref:ATP-binding protein n=1 Tax=Pseudofrankia sp. BMG5.37 TaxID=3050035 RepID=UPI0028960F00|nr:AAA family ATPase [Pseudofrankia sp. BMG5.37]MDT3445340.1 AAA family ATPase [Pseudofrankia sp. BMG5.37]